METQNYTCCKRNYALLFFLHFRGTNHIAGSCLSIGKAGVYSKEQDKKKYSNESAKDIHPIINSVLTYPTIQGKVKSNKSKAQ